MQAQTEPKLHPETANMEFEWIWTSHHKAICNIEGWFEV